MVSNCGGNPLLKVICLSETNTAPSVKSSCHQRSALTYGRNLSVKMVGLKLELPSEIKLTEFENR